MKTITAALLAVALFGSVSAQAKCVARQCSSVKIAVTSCAAAVLNKNGILLPLAQSSHAETAGEVRGSWLRGRIIAEHAIACYPGLPAKSGPPDNKGADFFVGMHSLACETFAGKVVVGETDHPCCDIPPKPGDTHPGTCNTQVRLMQNVRVDIPRKAKWSAANKPS